MNASKIRIGDLETGARVRFGDDSRFPLYEIFGRFGPDVYLRRVSEPADESIVDCDSNVAYAEHPHVLEAK